MKYLPRIFSFLAVWGLSGCFTGPKESNRTLADKLNYENYKRVGHVGGIPFGETRPVQRKISGRVLCGQSTMSNPVNNAVVSLQKDDQVIGSTSTTADGKYVVTGRIDAVGNYTLVVKSHCGEKSLRIPAGLTHELREQNFYLQN